MPTRIERKEKLAHRSTTAFWPNWPQSDFVRHYIWALVYAIRSGRGCVNKVVDLILHIIGFHSRKLDLFCKIGHTQDKLSKNFISYIKFRLNVNRLHIINLNNPADRFWKRFWARFRRCFQCDFCDLDVGWCPSNALSWKCVTNLNFLRLLRRLNICISFARKFNSFFCVDHLLEDFWLQEFHKLLRIKFITLKRLYTFNVIV
jgi:hypothetical protein